MHREPSLRQPQPPQTSKYQKRLDVLLYHLLIAGIVTIILQVVGGLNLHPAAEAPRDQERRATRWHGLR